MRQRGLAYAGHVFDQQMAAGQHAGQGLADLQFFADQYFADLARGLVYFQKHGVSIVGQGLINLQ